MPQSFDHNRQPLTIPTRKQAQPTGSRGPSWEIILVIVSVLLPFAILGWRILIYKPDTQIVSTDGQRSPHARNGRDASPSTTRSSQSTTRPASASSQAPQDETETDALSQSTAADPSPVESVQIAADPVATLPQPVKQNQGPVPATIAGPPKALQQHTAPAPQNLGVLVTQTPAQQRSVAAGKPTVITGNAPTATSPKAQAASPVGGIVSTLGGSPVKTTVPMAGYSNYPKSKTDAPAAVSSDKPTMTATDPKTERLLDEAWGLIERGDYGPGRSRLMDAFKSAPKDPRAGFSLGLLDSLVDQDWRAAEKRFADSVRRLPDNVAALNNLAIAQLHNKREAEAVKRWKKIVDRKAVTPEVVQNLGRARYLIEKGEIRKNASVVKLLDELYTQAAVATSLSSKPEVGFSIMALRLADGRSAGWANARKMVDTAPFSVAKSSATTIATGPRGAATPQGIPISGILIPTPGTVDPRMQPSGAFQRGTSSPTPPASSESRSPRTGHPKHSRSNYGTR